MGLADQECIPCKGGISPLSLERSQELLKELPRWELIENHHLSRAFSFPDFRSALDFAQEIGELAEAQNHHPDIYLGWGKVRVDIWTHKINGLTESDFVFAAKCDRLR